MWRVIVSSYSGDTLVWRHIIPKLYQSKHSAVHAGRTKCNNTADDLDRVYEVVEVTEGDSNELLH